jgi:hypothetical protein
MSHRPQEQRFVFRWKAALMTAVALSMMAAPAAYACDCSAPLVGEALSRADVVFRGTIVALRPSTKPIGFIGVTDTGRIAIFHVSRVWKGDVGATFEMPAHEEAAACWGFWPNLLKAGNDLLVYAYLVPGETESGGTFMFETNICSRTAPTRANEDLKALGAGYEPGRSPQALQRRAFYMWAVAIVVIGVLISYFIQGRLSSRRR